MKAVVEVVAGKEKGKQVAIKKNQMVVFGRTEWSDVPFPTDPQMSGKHFSLENDTQSVTLRDLNSTNGTKLNGEFVESAKLNDGDQVTAGLTTFAVHIDMTMDSATPAQLAESPGTPNSGSAPPTPGLNPQPQPPEPSTPIGSPIVFQPSSTPETPPANSPVAAPSTGNNPTPPTFSPPAEPSSPIVLPASSGSAPSAPQPATPPAEAAVSPIASPATPESPNPGASPPSSSPVSSSNAASPISSPAGQQASASSGSPPAAPSDKVLDRRRPASYTGSRTVIKHRLPNNLLKYESDVSATSEPPPLYPSTLLPVFTKIGAPIGILHYQKAGKEIDPRKLKSSIPLFKWLPVDIGRTDGPVLLTADQIDDIKQHLDELWDDDAAVCFLCSDAKAAADHVQQLVCPPTKKENQPPKLVGICWPSVCQALLEQCEEVKWKEWFGSGINAALIEPAEKKGAWLLFTASGEVDGLLSQAGFNLVEPSEPSAKSSQ